ncbi:hypothetical protein [Tsukamurella tyrosinosolvens]|uniref:hypothetical protein n=1 Tax=Tsukamurella tyrosinosolvens TaxID=57704 RepID=UPI00079CB89A|nr:hypothetical protein [Tsukamurella tyrosinosolvens]KXP08548.1 hypothetical protein AXK59_23625 [Tsukamurella tyrosinosolvens]
MSFDITPGDGIVGELELLGDLIVGGFPEAVFTLPGVSVDEVLDHARLYLGFAEAAESAHARVRGLEVPEFVGVEGEFFRGRVPGELAMQLGAAVESYSRVGSGIKELARELDASQAALKPLEARARAVFEHMQRVWIKVNVPFTEYSGLRSEWDELVRAAGVVHERVAVAGQQAAAAITAGTEAMVPVNDYFSTLPGGAVAGGVVAQGARSTASRAASAAGGVTGAPGRAAKATADGLGAVAGAVTSVPQQITARGQQLAPQVTPDGIKVGDQLLTDPTSEQAQKLVRDGQATNILGLDPTGVPTAMMMLASPNALLREQSKQKGRPGRRWTTETGKPRTGDAWATARGGSANLAEQVVSVPGRFVGGLTDRVGNTIAGNAALIGLGGDPGRAWAGLAKNVTSPVAGAGRFAASATPEEILKDPIAAAGSAATHAPVAVPFVGWAYGLVEAASKPGELAREGAQESLEKSLDEATVRNFQAGEKVANTGEVQVTTPDLDVHAFDNGGYVSFTLPDLEGGEPKAWYIMATPDSPGNFTTQVPTGPDEELVERGDGSVILTNTVTGEIARTIKAPWAKDALGRDQPTWYSVERLDDSTSTITQHVAPNKNALYPLVADAPAGRQPIAPPSGDGVLVWAIRTPSSQVRHFGEVVLQLSEQMLPVKGVTNLASSPIATTRLALDDMSPIRRDDQVGKAAKTDYVNAKVLALSEELADMDQTDPVLFRRLAESVGARRATPDGVAAAIVKAHWEQASLAATHTPDLVYSRQDVIQVAKGPVRSSPLFKSVTSLFPDIGDERLIRALGPVNQALSERSGVPLVGDRDTNSQIGATANRSSRNVVGLREFTGKLADAGYGNEPLDGKIAGLVAGPDRKATLIGPDGAAVQRTVAERGWKITDHATDTANPPRPYRSSIPTINTPATTSPAGDTTPPTATPAKPAAVSDVPEPRQVDPVRTSTTPAAADDAPPSRAQPPVTPEAPRSAPTPATAAAAEPAAPVSRPAAPALTSSPAAPTVTGPSPAPAPSAASRVGAAAKSAWQENPAWLSRAATAVNETRYVGTAARVGGRALGVVALPVGIVADVAGGATAAQAISTNAVGAVAAGAAGAAAVAAGAAALPVLAVGAVAGIAGYQGGKWLWNHALSDSQRTALSDSTSKALKSVGDTASKGWRSFKSFFSDDTEQKPSTPAPPQDANQSGKDTTSPPAATPTPAAAAPPGGSTPQQGSGTGPSPTQSSSSGSSSSGNSSDSGASPGPAGHPEPSNPVQVISTPPAKQQPAPPPTPQAAQPGTAPKPPAAPVVNTPKPAPVITTPPPEGGPVVTAPAL